MRYGHVEPVLAAVQLVKIHLAQQFSSEQGAAEGAMLVAVDNLVLVPLQELIRIIDAAILVNGDCCRDARVGVLAGTVPKSFKVSGLTMTSLSTINSAASSSRQARRSSCSTSR